MLILFLGTGLVVWIGFNLVSEMIERVKLKEFDRQLGALFGAAKGVLLCVLITLFSVAPAGRLAAAGDLQLEVRLLHCRPARQGRHGDSRASCTRCSTRTIDRLDPERSRTPHTGWRARLSDAAQELQDLIPQAASKTARPSAAQPSAPSFPIERASAAPAAQPSSAPQISRPHRSPSRLSRRPGELSRPLKAVEIRAKTARLQVFPGKNQPAQPNIRNIIGRWAEARKRVAFA